MHGLLLLRRLAVDDAVPQVSEILQLEKTRVIAHIDPCGATSEASASGSYLLVEQDEA